MILMLSIKMVSFCVRIKLLGQSLNGIKQEASIRVYVLATLDALNVLQAKKLWSKVYRRRII